MELFDLWKEKLNAGLIRHDPDLLVIRRYDAPEDEWGTLYFSESRERYKSEVKSRPNTSFDLQLMDRLYLAEHGSLIIAANPNSLFPCHLVIYPRQKSPELTAENLSDIVSVAFQHPNITFIHNGSRSAASILDWAHFQAYAIDFPIFGEKVTQMEARNGLEIGTTSCNFPAYALHVQGDQELISRFLVRINEELARNENPQRARIPVNYIWREGRAWIVPRAKGQSHLAANFFGGLEMGGIFCLPSAAELRSYLPSSLRATVIEATLRCKAEADTRNWFENFSRHLL